MVVLGGIFIIGAFPGTFTIALGGINSSVGSLAGTLDIGAFPATFVIGAFPGTFEIGAFPGTLLIGAFPGTLLIPILADLLIDTASGGTRLGRTIAAFPGDFTAVGLYGL